MTDAPNPEKPIEADRIAKVMARAGVASRREAERMILEGRVTVNGKKIESPALDVLPSDNITVDGKKLDEPQETRLWLYYKPVGLVTSEADEKGRQTVFDALPRDLPRVMSVGRLDLNSEGLLLLTNDGELKRRLELPETGWLRRYRVRVNGQPNDLTFAPLRRGVTIEGEDFAPMEIKLDSQQGANAWLTVGIREGKNREIRRAMAHVGLQVNRLIRIGYGPFKLTGMEENEVREIKRRVLRDQLGGLLTGEVEDKERPYRERGAEDNRSDYRSRRREDGRGGAAEGRDRPFARNREGGRNDDGERRPFSGGGSRERRSSYEGAARPYAKRGERDEKPNFRGGERRPYATSDAGDRPRKPRYGTDDAARGASGGRNDGENKRFSKGGDAQRRPYTRGEGSGRPDREERRGYGEKTGEGRSFGGRGGKPRFSDSNDKSARNSRGGDESRAKSPRDGFKSGGKRPANGERSGGKPTGGGRHGKTGGGYSRPDRSGPSSPRRPKG